MILGTGYAIIALYDEDETLHDFGGNPPNPYSLSGVEQAGLAQIQDPEDLDTDGIEIMDNGDRKKISLGVNARIQIPIQVVDNITPTAWGTFVNSLRGWQEKIKVTPWHDEPTYAYWVLLADGRSLERPQIARNLMKITTLQFVGAKRISSIS
jgi:hypothetical protein